MPSICPGPAMLSPDSPLVTVTFDPSLRHLQRVLQCLERTGKTTYVALEEDSLHMLQKPTASNVQLTTWTTLAYSFLAMTRPNQSVTFEIHVTTLLAILRSVESHPLATIQIHSRHLQLHAGHPPAIHEVAITLVDQIREPTVPRPDISFQIPAIRLGVGAAVNVRANGEGTMMVGMECEGMNVNLRYGKVRVVGTRGDDGQKLIGMTVGVKLLQRALNVRMYIEGCTLICSIIPEQTLIISASFLDPSNFITFYIPSLDQVGQ